MKLRTRAEEHIWSASFAAAFVALCRDGAAMFPELSMGGASDRERAHGDEECAHIANNAVKAYRLVEDPPVWRKLR